jgi:peptidase M23-like protein
MSDRRRRVWPGLAGVAALLLGGCTAVPGVTASGPVAASPTASVGVEQFTPAVMRVMSTPRWFTGSDGRVHLVYELELTNALNVPTTVTAVTVRDAANGTVLLALSGDALKASMSLLASPTEPTVELAASTIGVVWVDVVLVDPAGLPARLDHELTVSIPPGLPVPAVITDVGGAADVDRRPAIAIGSPLEGRGWIAAGSCCDGPHRRSVQPINGALWLAQRFAIDFNKINDDGLLAVGDRDKNASWLTYDQPVLAVADADVVVAADGFPDQVPEAAKPVTIEEADGNHVILKLPDGVYAFYAHLKPGSIRVKPGQRVSKGQKIAQTGNSGSSTGPHLHFQLMDRPSALVADGLPYVFDQFTVSGRSPALETLIALDPTKDPVPIDTATAGPRRNELPLGRDVLEFPGG